GETFIFAARLVRSFQTQRLAGRFGANQVLDARESGSLRACVHISRLSAGGATGGGHLAADAFAGALRARLIAAIVRAQTCEQSREREAHDDCQNEPLTHGVFLLWR